MRARLVERTNIPSTSAPDSKRMVVKLAASIAVWWSAARHKRELPAKASSANDIRLIKRIRDKSAPGDMIPFELVEVMLCLAAVLRQRIRCIARL